MVAIDIGMPSCCVTYTSENDNYVACPFYKICKQRETIETNYKPTDCPLVEIGICKDCKHWDKKEERCLRLSSNNGWFEDEYYQVYTDNDFYCKYFEKRGDSDDSNQKYGNA